MGEITSSFLTTRPASIALQVVRGNAAAPVSITNIVERPDEQEWECSLRVGNDLVGSIRYARASEFLEEMEELLPPNIQPRAVEEAKARIAGFTGMLHLILFDAHIGRHGSAYIPYLRSTLEKLGGTHFHTSSAELTSVHEMRPQEFNAAVSGTLSGRHVAEGLFVGCAALPFRIVARLFSRRPR
jgi:hypothetical protein